MAVPIINDWAKYFDNPDEGLGSSYERVILNQLLDSICEVYHIQSALETPCFGFTGVSGINLVNLAKQGIKVSLEDHDLERITKINELWQELRLHIDIKYNPEYVKLDYPDKHFDLGFNFSALWFTQNIRSFLAEFCRVCKKAILICVPNRDGIGFKMQMKDYSPKKYPYLHPAHLDLATIKYLMKQNKWLLQQEGYIDCPPWPDIGMKKELFFKKLVGKQEIQEKNREPLSILSYYQEENNDFISRMLSYGFVEKTAPPSFKKHWAHHYYLLFTPDNG
ncbi:MAG: methyltransferase domain-containing protein [Candidatus Cloacimonetes bacterium]|nr:methyltransferase domain-containing protein [Candidatus Cloacimonadota bacterium]